MSESVQFWLDNKMSAGIKMAAIGEQLLVVYRDKFYVVERGAAQMRGGKPLHFSKTSMPAVWKRALRGDAVQEALAPPSETTLPVATSTRKVRTKPENPQPADHGQVMPQTQSVERPPTPPQSAGAEKPPKSVKKTDPKPVTQTTVAANCPHCHHKHDLPLEKGKNGKPFFTVCSKCKAEFAVRFVPVTVYQAQVAGFR